MKEEWMMDSLHFLYYKESIQRASTIDVLE